MYFLNQTFLGNTVQDYIWFLSIIIVGLIFQRLLAKVLTKFIYRFLKRYSTGVSFESLLELLKRPMVVSILLITLFIAFNHLSFPPAWKLVGPEKFGLRMVIYRTFEVAMVLSITWIILRIVDFFGLIFIYRASLTESKTDDQLIPFVKEFVKILIAIFSVFFILGTVFNLNITSLIAGLGIGGLAIALAAKESLENLLGSFTIFLDKPFVIGDFVKIGSVQGNVERIGFRSTRIRTVDKTFVTVPNKKMVDSELDNISLRSFWRVRFDLGIVLETKEDQLKEILFQIRKYVSEHKLVINETTIHFLDFSEYSLKIYVQYFINTTDWELFCQTKEEINFKIIEIIRKNGSDLAYPAYKIRQLAD